MKQALKYIYERLIETLKFAESKHNISLTLASGVIVFAVSFIYQKIFLVSILSSACIMFCLIAILYSFFALTAKKVKIKKKKISIKKYNLTYYKDIVNFDDESFMKQIKKSYGFKGYTPDDFDLDLSKQIIATSRSIERKLSYFNLSIVFLFVGIICLAIAICIIGGQSGL